MLQYRYREENDMTLERLINCIHYNSWIPPRPEGISEVRWEGMIKMAHKIYQERLQEEAKND